MSHNAMHHFENSVNTPNFQTEHAIEMWFSAVNGKKVLNIFVWRNVLTKILRCMVLKNDSLHAYIVNENVNVSGLQCRGHHNCQSISMQTMGIYYYSVATMM